MWLTKVGAAPTDGIGNQRRKEHNRLPRKPAMMTDPESMTAEERRLEVASILARGVLRRICLADSADSSPHQTVPESPQKHLDLPVETRLSVAPRPAG
jgi:hypothetical protein